MRFAAYILPFLSLTIVTLLGFLPRWHFTLSGDLQNYYYPIAQHILTDQTLIYPPGANLFFMLFPTNSFYLYQYSFVSANILLAIIILILTKKPIVFSLIVLAAGPIILFRFDLLVIALIVLTLKTFAQKRFFLSGFFLGLATITKFFPIIFLPYLWLVLPRKKWVSLLSSFLLTIILIFGIFLRFAQADWLIVVNSFYFNFAKSVHMESVMGSLLTVITSFTNPGPHGVEFTSALWVLSPLYLLGHARIFRFFAPVGLALIYSAIFFRWRTTKTLSVILCLLIVLTLIVTSQAFSPQYLLWFSFLFLLLSHSELKTTFWKTNLFLVLLSLVCTQIIYPLNYGELIDFFNLGKNQHLFLVLLTRNVLLIILFLRLFFHEKLLPFLQKK